MLNIKKNKSTVLLSVCFLIFLNACSSDNENITNNRTVTKIPATLQKLATGNGTLSAYIQLDGSSVQIPMLINPEGNGTASAILPGLTRRVHSILITYEYTDSQGDLILAQASKVADLSAGSTDLNVDVTDYSLNFDKDSDGINNADELLAGTDPRIPIFTNNPLLLLDTSAAIPKIIIDNTKSGTLRGFATLDANSNTRFEMTIDTTTALANVSVTNIENKLYTLLVSYEYTDSSGTVVLATANREVDLRVRGREININESEFDFITHDDDNDGTYNIDEIIQGTNPVKANTPIAPTVNLTYEGVKTFRFSWEDVGSNVIFYQLLENTDGNSGFDQVSINIPANTQIFNHVVTLYLRQNAQYILRSCNDEGCTDSPTINVKGSLAGSIGYFKIDRPTASMGMSMSGDGKTLAIKRRAGDATIFNNSSGSWREQALIRRPYSYNFVLSQSRIVSLSSDGTTLAMLVEDNRIGSGINSTISTTTSGAFDSFGSVYVFIRVGENWQQQAYIKASNPDIGDFFGTRLSLSDDGNTLAVGASSESSNAKGTSTTINQLDNTSVASGAVYVFSRTDTGIWSQQAYIKASNTDINDGFGNVSLSGDGLTLAVGAIGEDSSLTNITPGNGLQEPINNSAENSGAVYIFTLDKQLSSWSQEAYIKSNNSEASDFFGSEISLNRDGNIMAVTARGEDSFDRNDFNNNSSSDIGAVYIFERSTSAWIQQDYIKPNTIHTAPRFGSSLSLNSDGKMLAVGSAQEKSNAIGLNGDQTDIDFTSGAAYLFTRDINNKWNQQTYIKASNTELGDTFGEDIILSDDGSVLAVRASGEDSNATGINGDQLNNDAENTGAVYLY